MIKTLLSALIFAIPLGVVARINLLPNVYIYPHDIIVGLIALFVSYQFVVKRIRPQNLKILIMVLLFFGIGFLSLILNLKYLNHSSFLISLLYAVRLLAYFSIFFAFQFLNKDFFKKIPIKMLMAGFIFTVIGLIQYVFFNDLSFLYHLGWDEHLYRLFSTFLDPNFAGAFLAINIILTLHIFLEGKKEKIQIVQYGGILLLSFLALLLTYSRSAILMLCFGLVTYFVITKRLKAMLFAFLFIIVAFFAFSNKNIEGLNPFRIASVEARLASADEAIKIISDHLIFGTGFNSYRYVLLEYGYRHEVSTKISNADSSTDNSYLFVLATTGIIGFFVYIDLWINFLKLLFREFKTNRFAYAVFACGAALMVNSLFINSLFYTPILAWVLILIGITVNRKR